MKKLKITSLLVVAGGLAVATAACSKTEEQPAAQTTETLAQPAEETLAVTNCGAAPCAAKNCTAAPCEAKPCAAKPCAPKPCAAKPCAAKQ